MERRLARAGYRVIGFEDPERWLDHCLEPAAEPPVAVLMDMDFPEGPDAGARAVERVREARPEMAGVPLIYASAHGDLASRLRAVRTGARRYLTKPVEVERLVGMLDGFTRRRPADPFRVLLVADPSPEGEAYVAALAGMEVRRLDDPLEMLSAMEDAAPDVVVLAFRSEHCTSLELARALRDVDRFARLPLLFLTREPFTPHEHLEVLELGGVELSADAAADDRLAGLVAARAMRSRHLRRVESDLHGTLRELERQRFALDEHAIVSATDVAGRITYVNDRFCAISGYRREELVGRNHRLVNSGHHPPEFFRELWATITRGEVWHGEVRNRRKDGGYYWVEATVVPFLDDQGRPERYVSIRTDITHIKAIEARLREVGDEALRAARAKSELLARVSHEFRTPLNAIDGFCQLLEYEEGMTADQLDSVAEIRTAGARLLWAVDELIHLSEVESGTLELELGPTEVEEMLAAAVMAVESRAAARGVTFSIPPCEGMTAVADRNRLEPVLARLLDNAALVSPEGGEVSVELEKRNGRLRISVADRGPGLPDEDVEAPFLPLRSLKSGDRRDTVGVSLAIGRRLVEAMGGAMGVESETSVGSRFWIELNDSGLNDGSTAEAKR